MSMQRSENYVSHLTRLYENGTEWKTFEEKDLKFLQRNSERMHENMKKNINSILKNIHALPIGSDKKYQISGTEEWKEIQRRLLGYLSPTEYELCYDDFLSRKKVVKIFRSSFYRDPHFEREYRKVRYIRVMKRRREWFHFLLYKSKPIDERRKGEDDEKELRSTWWGLFNNRLFDVHVMELIRGFLIG